MLWSPPQPGWLGALIDDVDTYSRRRARALARLLRLGVHPWDVDYAAESKHKFSYVVRKYRKRIERRHQR